MSHEKTLPALRYGNLRSIDPNSDIEAMENSTCLYAAIGLRDITPTILEIIGNVKTIFGNCEASR